MGQPGEAVAKEAVRDQGAGLEPETTDKVLTPAALLSDLTGSFSSEMTSAAEQIKNTGEDGGKEGLTSVDFYSKLKEAFPEVAARVEREISQNKANKEGEGQDDEGSTEKR